ncbi:hypothetical protein KSF_065150 [Reticulibacter mediterranei]|uniref:Uncharacterized protein n=1 Tax=Reticulibacter mediterranei TaxID=2778369 RepID=A0A8J3N6T9_9CHLR|nr:hypothetical protein KSF_065150 [Reticulibacter mediterranei]
MTLGVSPTQLAQANQQEGIARTLSGRFFVRRCVTQRQMLTKRKVDASRKMRQVPVEHLLGNKKNISS